jgi:2-dehydropantoate 2-reductase
MNSTSKPKIAVVGAGAVGSVVGGLLARVGEDVTLIARKAHVDAINAHGLHVAGALGKFIVTPKVEEELRFSPDLTILTVKTQDVETVCRQIKPYVTGAPLVSLQNGVRSDDMASEVFGKDSIIAGVVLFNAAFLNPGYVTCGVKGSLLVGEVYSENGGRVKKIAAILDRAIKTKVYNNIRGVRWTKLLVNALGNSMEALTGLSVGECMRYPGVRKIGIFILREAFKVLGKARVKLESLPDLPISMFKSVIHSPMPVASWLLSLTMSDMNTVTSTLQSIRKGKRTEIDYLNGEIVRLGGEMDIATPFNSNVVELVHKVEETHRFYPPHRFEAVFSAQKINDY